VRDAGSAARRARRGRGGEEEVDEVDEQTCVLLEKVNKPDENKAYE
jgi:hypothetical protein